MLTLPPIPPTRPEQTYGDLPYIGKTSLFQTAVPRYPLSFSLFSSLALHSSHSYNRPIFSPFPLPSRFSLHPLPIHFSRFSPYRPCNPLSLYTGISPVSYPFSILSLSFSFYLSPSDPISLPSPHYFPHHGIRTSTGDFDPFFFSNIVEEV